MAFESREAAFAEAAKSKPVSPNLGAETYHLHLPVARADSRRQCAIHNHFNQERHLNSRDIFKQNRSAALAEWRQLAA